jgi:tRNA nucleotidyltransferase (CCA-adding enzyme)
MGKKESYRKVADSVLSRIRPDSSVKKKCEEVVFEISSGIKKARIDADAVLGGSIAKGTFLRDDYDCDIFVRFALDKYRKKDISALLKKVLSKFSPEEVSGSRNYYQFERAGIHFEIVPVLLIKKSADAANVIDVSPMHVAWIKKGLSRKKNLSDEVRLARAFCRGIGVYGAESFINGFSGHVIDILTIYYGGFRELLSASLKWKERAVVDPENYHRGKALFSINKSKTEGPLVLVDPVQPYRNASASLSKEKFEIFKGEAGKFLKNPSESFFDEKKMGLKKEPGRLIIEARSIPGKKDVAGCRVKKAFEYILEKFADNDFKVLSSSWEWDKKSAAHFSYFFDIPSLRKAESEHQVTRAGPPVSLKAHAAAFRKKYRRTFEKQGKVYARVLRKYNSPKRLVSALVKDKYLKTKVSSIRLLE